MYTMEHILYMMCYISCYILPNIIKAMPKYSRVLWHLIYTHNGMLCNSKKEQNDEFCCYMGGLEDIILSEVSHKERYR